MRLLQGDNLPLLKLIEDNSVDAVVTDPPYGLSFMGKKWDYDVPSKELWEEVLRVLKPGGHLLSFSGTRTYHRMAVNIEDAGFEIRDMIEWVYGSGFPKSLNIGKAVDKLQGNEREVVGINEQELKASKREKYTSGDNRDWSLPSGTRNVFNRENTARITKGTSEWEGWGTALKPAHEPICMARKPLTEKSVALNVLKYGTGGINIDESRVGTEERYNAPAGNKAGGNSLNMSAVGMPQDVDGTTAIGRFPANLVLEDCEEVRECFPESASGAKKANQENYNHEGKYFVATLGASINEYQASSGNASRFFKSIIYQAKASKSERNRGCEELYLLRDNTPKEDIEEIKLLLSI